MGGTAGGLPSAEVKYQYGTLYVSGRQPVRHPDGGKEVGLLWPRMLFPRGACACDGPNCCLHRGRVAPGTGIQVDRPGGDVQGAFKWFCSVECQVQREKGKGGKKEMGPKIALSDKPLKQRH